MKKANLEKQVLQLHKELAELKAKQMVAPIQTPPPLQLAVPQVSTQPAVATAWYAGHLVTICTAVVTALVTAVLTVYVNSAVMTERLKINSDEVANLRNQTKALEAQTERIKALSDELSNVRAQTKALEVQATTNQSGYNTLHGTYIPQLQSLQTKMTQLDGETVGLFQEVSKMSAQVEHQSGDVSSLQQKMDKLSADLTSVRERIAGLEATHKK